MHASSIDGSAQTALQKLAGWAVDTNSIPDSVEHAARRLLMDQVGVSIAGGKALATIAPGETVGYVVVDG